MIRVTVTDEAAEALQEGSYVKWGFARAEGNRLSAALTRDQFEEFLKENNLIVYKNNIKAYQDGEEVGEFNVD